MALNEQKITVSSKDFSAFLGSILNVYRGGATLVIHRDFIDALILSEDNASIIMYAKVMIADNSCPDQEPTTIHVRDLTKFSKLIDFSKEDLFEFTIKNNYVYFESKKIGGAKFILDENPIRKINNRINVEWFKQFEPYFWARVTRDSLKEISQLSSFANNSDKVYIYEENGKVIAELNDREKVNIDTIKAILTEEYEGHIKGTVILNLDSLGCLSNISHELMMQSAKIQNSEALFFIINTGTVFLEYLFASKVR